MLGFKMKHHCSHNFFFLQGVFIMIKLQDYQCAHKIDIHYIKELQ